MEQHLMKIEIFNASLDEISKSLESIISLLPDPKRIWHRDCLELVRDENDLISGQVDVGDCLDDLWLITWILFETSRKIPQAVFRLQDQDGEFLLIEAALVLPRWANPEALDGRLFLRGGNLHWITQDECADPELSSEIIRKLFSNSSDDHYLCPEAVQQAIQRKLLLTSSQQQIHHAKCIVPRDIARILVQEPRWIAMAVEAFYLRDLISVRYCQRMDRFPPSESVVTRVKFSRTLYSQLVSHQFGAPRPFLKVENLGLLLTSRDEQLSMQRRWAELGMKIACGFEILMNETRNNGSLICSDDDLTVEKYPFDEDSRWISRLRNLQRNGHFKNEKVGSSEYNALLRNAQEHYLKKLKERHKETIEQLRGAVSFPADWSKYRRLNARREIQLILGNSREQMDDSEFDLHLEKCGFWADDVEDDDQWMTVDPQELQDLLEERTGIATGHEEIEDIHDKNLDLNKMMEKLSKLISTESGYEGVDMNDSDRDSEDDQLSEDSPDSDFCEIEEQLMEELKGGDGTDFERDDASRVLKNLLSSFSAQNGEAGPVGTILGSMGMNIPADYSDEESDESSFSDA